METMRTLKAIIARLAGAPLSSWPAKASHRSTHESGLYAAVVPEPRRTSKQRDGDEGEDFARRHLERAGLFFVAANVVYRDGELDLVMRDPVGASTHGTTLVFVEVRRRAHGSHGGAAASVTREKRRRVVAAASHYLVGLGLRALPTCRFDVVTIEGDRHRGFRVEWIRDAFRDEG